jgi:hypothetical protein
MVSVLFPSHLCSVSLCPFSLFSVSLWEITNCYGGGSVWTSPTLSFFSLHFVWAWNIHRRGGGGGGGGGNESQDLINVLFLWVFAGVFERCLSFRVFFFGWVWFFSLTRTNTKEGRNHLCFVCVCVDVEIWVSIFLPRPILFHVSAFFFSFTLHCTIFHFEGGGRFAGFGEIAVSVVSQDDDS